MVSVRPGPISMNASTPAFAMFTMVCSHSTGLATCCEQCAYGSGHRGGGWAGGDVGVHRNTGSEILTWSSSSPRRAPACWSRLEWNGPDTFSHITRRAPRCHRHLRGEAHSLGIAGDHDLPRQLKWPPPQRRRFAPRHTSSTASRPRPSTVAIAPAPGGHASP